MHPASAALLRWYAKNKRDLPWRKTHDLYKIWVSEAMLQQTRVDQAIPYYKRFVNRFPTVQTLARASQDDVLKAWEGMGYYSRARNLHAAAKAVERNGWPKNSEEWQRLPGIGPYIGNAIAAIASDQNEIALDANLFRVGARLFGTNSRERVERELKARLPDGNAGDFNQALMDLGAGICLPRMPLCPSCPMQNYCHATRLDDPGRFPRKEAKKPKSHYDVAVAVIYRKGKVLIAKRPDKGLLGGLWEFPGGKLENGERPESACKREIREELGIGIRVGERLATVKHEYTHMKVTLHVFRCTARGIPHSQRQWQWVTKPQLKKFPMPKADHKFMEKV